MEKSGNCLNNNKYFKFIYLLQLNQQNWGIGFDWIINKLSYYKTIRKILITVIIELHYAT